MSLLNEVLRDIDQRRREARDEQILTSILVAEDKKSLDWKSPAIVFTFIFLCGTLTFLAVNQTTAPEGLSSTFSLPKPATPLRNSLFMADSMNVSAILNRSTRAILEQPPILLPRESKVSAPQEVASQTSPVNVDSVQDRVQERVSIRTPVSAAVPSTPLSVADVISGYVANTFDAEQLYRKVIANANHWSASELEAQLAKLSYLGRSVDDLVNLLELNRYVGTLNGADRSESLMQIYSQLRLKSDDPGYWAFQQAVLHDKKAEAREAYYYYRQAVQSADVSPRQRSLSELRVKQLRYQLR